MRLEITHYGRLRVQDSSLDEDEVKPNQPFVKLVSESGVQHVHYHTLFEGLPKEFQAQAEKELNETEERKRNGIQRLKDLIRKENLDPLNDYLLLAVLRSSKYNVKKSENKLRKFVAQRREIMKKLMKMDMGVIEKCLADMGGGILPYRDRHGRAILFTRPYGLNTEDYAMEDAGLLFIVIILFALSYEMTTVAGITYFGECKSPNIYIFYPIFKLFKQYAHTVLSFPLRISKVEILNEFTLIRWFYKVMYSLLPDKLLKRVTFNGLEYDNLHKTYSPDLLPEDFGGNMGPLDSKFYMEEILKFIKDLRTEAKSLGISSD